MYKVIEVQGSTYAVHPIEGGKIKRVHRSKLRPCVSEGLVPAPRIRKPPAKEKPTSVLEKEVPPLDVECVRVEEVQSQREAPVLNAALKRQEPCVVESENSIGDSREEKDEVVSPGFESGEVSNVALKAEPEFVGLEYEGTDLPVEVPVLKHIPVPRKKRESSTQLHVSCPEPQRTHRSTAGVHTNPYRLPKSACNSLTLSQDVLSQVLAGMVLYTSGKLQGGLEEGA